MFWFYLDIIFQIKKSTNPPFRPDVPNDICHPDFHDMMRQCWAEFPNERLRFDDIMKTLKKINGGK